MIPAEHDPEFAGPSPKAVEVDPVAEMWRWRPTDRDLGARITLAGIGLLLVSLVLIVAGAVWGFVRVIEAGATVAFLGTALGTVGTRLRIERFAARIAASGHAAEEGLGEEMS